MNSKFIQIYRVIVFMMLLHSCSNYSDIPFQQRIQPVAKNSGFKMEGYYVWGGSIIQVDGKFHMFASRWPAYRDFPHDYFTMSEIVRATADKPEGPYTFQEVVICERDSVFWDSNMAHNPVIYKIEDTFVLFYIGSDFTTMRSGNRPLRRVGYATARNIEGPWIRSDNPVINEESNNPALFVEPDGSVKLIYRDAGLRVFLATAPSYEGPFSVQNDNVWPDAKIEDFYLFKRKNRYHLICEDNVAHVTGHERWGAHLVSENGISDWQVHEHPVVYSHDIVFDDGSVLNAVRRERPVLFIDDGAVRYLLTSVFDGQNTWCQPVKIFPPYKVDQ